MKSDEPTYGVVLRLPQGYIVYVDYATGEVIPGKGCTTSDERELFWELHKLKFRSMSGYYPDLGSEMAQRLIEFMGAEYVKKYGTRPDDLPSNPDIQY